MGYKNRLKAGDEDFRQSYVQAVCFILTNITH